jgi:5-methylcytosine-specific restriction endonuclease McrBC regulatory subunit McrC
MMIMSSSWYYKSVTKVVSLVGEEEAGSVLKIVQQGRHTSNICCICSIIINNQHFHVHQLQQLVVDPRGLL